MIHLNTHEIAIALALATGVDQMAFIAPKDSDLTGFNDILPSEALSFAQENGGAIISFPSSAEATIVYSNVERRMSLLPGGEVVLARANGAVSGTKRSPGEIVPINFGADTPKALLKAA